MLWAKMLSITVTITASLIVASPAGVGNKYHYQTDFGYA
jgi:hypothetical protein